MVRSICRASLVAAAALAVSAPAFADVKAGVDAWSRGDYAGAVKEWKVPSDQGDADALFNLGQAYKLGRGVSQDLRKAEDLFFKAAEKGHTQASDNYGLLLFQRGERARAMPYITAAADRGDPRAQYLLGLAYFNGENVMKDWTRAYALVSLAQQAGLAQAVPALAQMDQHIPLDQRQQSVKLAVALDAAATANRTRQLAAIDLGASVPNTGASRTASMSSPNFPPGADLPKVPPASKPARTGSGADYTGTKPPPPQIAAVADALEAAPAVSVARPAPPKPPTTKRPIIGLAPAKPAAVKPAAPKPALPKPAPPTTPKPAATSATGAWRVQLGAFGVAGNADALWNRVRNRPELAGRGKLLVPAGRLQKLQAGGFASQAEAQAACRTLSAAGFTCIPARN